MYTFAMIKPDAFRRGLVRKIEKVIKEYGFKISVKKRAHFTRLEAEEFYREHKGKDFFNRLVSFMSSGPVYLLVLEKENAVKEWRELIGPTNVRKAQSLKQFTIRGRFGKVDSPLHENLVHGSDSQNAARDEMLFCMKKLSGLPMFLFLIEHAKSLRRRK